MLTSVCPVQNKDVITQRVESKTVLFDMASGNYFSLNEIGARTWDMADGTRTLPEIADLLAAEYDAPVEIILEDIQALVKQLIGDGLLIEPKG